jgi:phospholipase A-2-activating protein
MVGFRLHIVVPVLRFIKGYVITGGQQVRDGRKIAPGEERVIKIFPLGVDTTEEPRSLIGHTNVVCALHVSPNGVIMSGSWDW